MTWYSKHVQQHVSHMANLPRAAKQAFVSFIKPNSKRHSWLVGSSLLLLLAPVSAYALHAQSNSAKNNVEDVLTSADELTKSVVDLNIESSLGQYGQSSKQSGNDIQSTQSAGQSKTGDISLQATIGNQSANITLNGDTTQLNPTNDSYHQSVQSDNGKTNIDISIKNGGVNVSGGGLNINTSSKINISSSNSSGDDQQSDSYSNDYYGRHERDR